MSSTLTWIDHDSEARERALRILTLFQERESRDELGLGAVRDSLADLLFPGTSTLHTRLRYMLFVPWIYADLESKGLKQPAFGREADRTERALVDPLVSSGDNAGVFGRTAGHALKRLPSSAYWAGLGAWGIRLTRYSQTEYRERIAETYERRASLAERRNSHRVRGDDLEPHDIMEVHNWHPRLPALPEGFPETVSLALTRDEANFVQDRIQAECGGSLLAHLALLQEPTECGAPWEHPAYASFTGAHVELLTHARNVSDLMHGAALSYNFQLAQRKLLDERKDEYQARFEKWAAELRIADLRDWSLDRLWKLTSATSHRVSQRTKYFVEEWRWRTTSSPGTLLTDESAKMLVRLRERHLKGPRSRFTNSRALDQWSGASGVGRLTYRWPNVQRLLHDLYDGLQR